MTEGAEPEITQPTSESSEKNSENSCCPSCNCTAPKTSSGNSIKIVVGALILLSASAIFAYKITQTKPVRKGSDTFTVQENYKSPVAPSAIEKQVTPPKAVPKQALKKMYVGNYLESIGSLNTVAKYQDAVLILVPANEKDAVKRETETAVLDAQRTLKTKGVNVGIYTLKTTSSDIQGISSQVSLPAVLVAGKGRGMTAVSGEITETKLLQAYVSACKTGSCGPSTSECGPAQTDCK